MASTRFTITGRLPGLNEMIGEARKNRFASSTQKKAETERCAWAAKAAGLKPVTSPVVVRIEWTEPDARRDVDNIAAGTKMILDGLVLAGVLPNDGRKWVTGLEHVFPAPDKKQARIEVELKPLKENV